MFVLLTVVVYTIILDSLLLLLLFTGRVDSLLEFVSFVLLITVLSITTVPSLEFV